MKLASLLLALMLGAGAVSAQDASLLPDHPVLLAQAGTAAPRRDNAVTSLNDRGAAAPAKPTAAGDDTFAIPSTPGAKPSGNSMNLWELVRKGGWAMIPLGFLSVVTVMLVIVFLFTLRRGAILTGHYMNQAEILIKKRDYLGLLAVSNRHSEAVARIVQRMLDFATKNPSASFETLRDIAETEGGSQAASLQHRVTFLADIAVVSPMVGLLGTVVGIMQAFGELGNGKVAVSRDIGLATGVSEALMATATGLILGMIAAGFYAIFRNKVQSLISDMEIGTAHITSLIAVHHNRKRDASRIAVEDEF